MVKKKEEMDVALEDDGITYVPCPWCGTKLPEGDVFCPVCGHETSEKPIETKKRKSKVPMLVAMGVFACLMMVVALLLFPTKKKQALAAAKHYNECRIILLGFALNPGKEGFVDAYRALVRYATYSQEEFEATFSDDFRRQVEENYDLLAPYWPQDQGRHGDDRLWIDNYRYEETDMDEMIQGIFMAEDVDTSTWTHACAISVDVHQENQEEGMHEIAGTKIYMMKNEGTWHVVNLVPLED